MSYFEFPHTRTYDGDLGYIIKKLTELEHFYNDFLVYNQITYADPIQWVISSTYKAYTIVTDEDTNASYISKKAVPAGIELSNSEYWLVLGSLVIDTDARAMIDKILKFITNAYETDTTATAVRYPGDYLVIGDTLYKVISEINVGDTYTENYNIIADTIENMVKALLEKYSAYVTPEMFGAVGNGVNDDTDAIQAALDSDAGIVLFKQGKVYRVTDTVYIGSNTVMNLNGSTIWGDMSNITYPVIRNKNYGEGGIKNIAITNGFVQGVGADNNVSDQGHAISFWLVDNVIISNIKTINTCGDGMGMRDTTNAIIQNVEIGNFGRNGISPTSGSFIFTNVNMIGTAFEGANPGRGFDAEPNSASDKVIATFYNCTFTDMTFVDFNTAEGGIFPFELSFNNVTLNGRPFALRFRATNHVKAKNIFVRDVRANILANTGKNIIVNNVSNIIFDNVYISHPAPSTANTTAFSGDFDHCTFKNMDLSMFTSNGYSVRGGFIDCTFENMIMRFFAETAFSGNKFINSTLSYYRGSSEDDDNNIFINTTAPSTLLTANKYWDPVKTQSYLIATNTDLIITHTSTHIAYMIVCETSGTVKQAIYLITGRGTGTLTIANKVFGDDLLTIVSDDNDLKITLTNIHSANNRIMVIPIYGDATITEGS